MLSRIRTAAAQRTLRIGALAALFFAAGACGAEESHKAVLSAYTNGAAGASLLAGDYASVIRRLNGHGAAFHEDVVAGSTNLCVAFIMTRHWEAAQAACDEALALAQLHGGGPTLYTRRDHDEQIALAYSNRAVLHWLQSQRDSAASDIAKAQALAPQASFVSQNVAVLGTKSA